MLFNPNPIWYNVPNRTSIGRAECKSHNHVIKVTEKPPLSLLDPRHPECSVPQAALASPRTALEMENLDPMPDLLYQNLNFNERPPWSLSLNVPTHWEALDYTAFCCFYKPQGKKEIDKSKWTKLVRMMEVKLLFAVSNRNVC